MRRVATALIVLVLTASVVPPAMGQDATFAREQASGEAYAGTHVAFNTSQSAVTDYAVHGETMLDSVKVESQSSVEDSALVDVGASLSAVTRIDGAGLSVGATTETEARVEAESGATMTAHDNGHGILVVASGDQSDYVVANLSSGANASAESDSQVEVTTENGTEGTFIVVGEGNVTVNDDGDVTAHLGDGGRLVFRSYPEGKDDSDDEQEQLIADGAAKAEAYVMAANESAGGGADAGEQVVVDTVSYGQNITVETTETAEGTVTFTVNRTTHEGTVLITSVSEEVLNASEDLEVTVDGEAAAEAATYSQLKSAIGSDQSRYVVESAGSASASADVLVAVNHFSERTVSMESASSDGTGEETTSDGETSGDEETTTALEETTNGDETTDTGETTDSGADDAQSDENNGGGVPGFGATAAVVALAGAALLARLR